MGRDIRFEIEFLLSLTVGVLGFLAISSVREVWIEEIGYTFLFLVGLHMVAFVTHYNYNQLTSLNIPYVQQLEEITKYTLVIITVVFFFLIFHIVFSGLYSFFHICGGNESIMGSFCGSYSIGSLSLRTLRTFFTIVIPFLAVLTLGAPLIMLLPTLRFFSNIDITISPLDLDIYDNYEQTRPLTITIQNKNKNGSNRDILIAITLPDQVKILWDGEEMNEFNEEVSLGPRRESTLNFDLKYIGQEHRSDKIDVEVKYGSVSKEESIAVTLY